MKQIRSSCKRFACMFLLAACWIAAAGSMRTYAVHTAVGVPASRSYVKADYKGRVIIFAGDSRTMYLTADNLKKYRKNCAFVWINGGSVSWIGKKGKLKPYLDKMISRYRKRCVVVFNFGINGNSSPKKNAGRIIKTYRQYMKKYPDVTFFAESVNPSGFQSNTGYGNKKIEKLNSLLQKEFGDQYIDVSSVLLQKKIVTKNGKGTKDNLHYKAKTNRAIYKQVKKFVNDYAYPEGE